LIWIRVGNGGGCGCGCGDRVDQRAEFYEDVDLEELGEVVSVFLIYMYVRSGDLGEIGKDRGRRKERERERERGKRTDSTNRNASHP